jgi:hypothetical protein
MEHEPLRKQREQAVRDFAERIYDGLPDYRELYIVYQGNKILRIAEQSIVLEERDSLYRVTRIKGVTTILVIS